MSVHGGDFTAAGPKCELDWFEQSMKDKYEITIGGRLGPGTSDDKAAIILNRVVKCTPSGLEYEADPRQVEKLLEELERSGEGVKGAVTPGVKVHAHKVAEEQQSPEAEFTKFRALAARANYLAADRPDIIFAAKESSFMSKPTDIAYAALKRLGRYLKAKPRLVFVMSFQSADTWDVYTDTDWAGCVRMGKSTSGGCLMLGKHVIKVWSSTQASLALSSGETEYYRVERGTGVGLGQQALGQDAGFRLPVRVWKDSSAAMGTASRQGLGKLRRLECHSLCFQQRLRNKEFELRKFDGTKNTADLFTKHMDSAEKLSKLIKMRGCEFRVGRAASAPQLKKACAVALAPYTFDEILTVSEEVLPHLLTHEKMMNNHPRAVPEARQLEEPDHCTREELRDPVPSLCRSRRTTTKTSVGAMDPQAVTKRSTRQHARSVGECLGSEVPDAHARPNGYVVVLKDHEWSIW